MRQSRHDAKNMGDARHLWLHLQKGSSSCTANRNVCEITAKLASHEGKEYMRVKAQRRFGLHNCTMRRSGVPSPSRRSARTATLPGPRSCCGPCRSAAAARKHPDVPVEHAEPALWRGQTGECSELAGNRAAALCLTRFSSLICAYCCSKQVEQSAEPFIENNRCL